MVTWGLTDPTKIHFFSYISPVRGRASRLPCILPIPTAGCAAVSYSGRCAESGAQQQRSKTDWGLGGPHVTKLRKKLRTPCFHMWDSYTGNFLSKPHENQPRNQTTKNLDQRHFSLLQKNLLLGFQGSVSRDPRTKIPSILFSPRE